MVEAVPPTLKDIVEDGEHSYSFLSFDQSWGPATTWEIEKHEFSYDLEFSYGFWFLILLAIENDIYCMFEFGAKDKPRWANQISDLVF